MSRSNPNEGRVPNPSTRWFEWNGEHGVVRYYDKEAKKNVEVGSDFTFILLDQLGTVKGWHDASDSGIYANEIRDTLQETLVVKSFKGGTLAEGRYRDIRDSVKAMGGQFVANCYIAYKNDDGTLKLGSMQFKGAALHAWAEFTKANRSDVYKKAVRIHGFTEGKKGRIIFRVPVLELAGISADTNNVAVALDAELQQFLKAYFKRTTREQVETPGDDYQDKGDTEYPEHPPVSEGLTDDDIPF